MHSLDFFGLWLPSPAAAELTLFPVYRKVRPAKLEHTQLVAFMSTIPFQLVLFQIGLPK
jgi:hypothetical protein